MATTERRTLLFPTFFIANRERNTFQGKYKPFFRENVRGRLRMFALSNRTYSLWGGFRR